MSAGACPRVGLSGARMTERNFSCDIHGTDVADLCCYLQPSIFVHRRRCSNRRRDAYDGAASFQRVGGRDRIADEGPYAVPHRGHGPCRVLDRECHFVSLHVALCPSPRLRHRRVDALLMHSCSRRSGVRGAGRMVTRLARAHRSRARHRSLRAPAALHTCAVVGGSAKCWGDNAAANWATEPQRRRRLPIQVSGLTSGVTALAAGMPPHVRADVSGGVKCWGTNSVGPARRRHHFATS